jgi:3'(2'), 5'-bisphosphate nucleotidase
LATDLELRAAIDAVRAAMGLTGRVQGRLAAGDTLTKGDDSPVTVADFAAQAVVCATLAEQLGEVELVGEEESGDLRADGRMLRGLVALVGEQLGGPVSPAAVLDWISLGGADGSGERYWTLDPIDGTKGFLRGDQYAIALALIERGEVVLGVLGCPNLPNADGSVGALFTAVDGSCRVRHAGRSVSARVATPAALTEARVCESVEASHSDHGRAAAVIARLGIAAEPYRIDSQCKYGAVARGDASISLRLPTRVGYHEKIWDHAAGKFVVEQAGGTVTDVDGAPLDFSRGSRLTANRGVVASDGRFHDEIVAAVRTVLADA